MIRPNFLIGKNGVLPSYGHNDDTNAGLDLYSAEDITIYPHKHYNKPTVVNLDIKWQPEFYTKHILLKPIVWVFKKLFKIYMKVSSRSGLAFNNYIEVGAGIIDQGFQGDFKVLCYNYSEVPYDVKKGDRIAQGIIYILPKVENNSVGSHKETIRSNRGFGSSGK